jgi:hypothetical protein
VGGAHNTRVTGEHVFRAVERNPDRKQGVHMPNPIDRDAVIEYLRKFLQDNLQELTRLDETQLREFFLLASNRKDQTDILAGMQIEELIRHILGSMRMPINSEEEERVRAEILRVFRDLYDAWSKEIDEQHKECRQEVDRAEKRVRKEFEEEARIEPFKMALNIAAFVFSTYELYEKSHEYMAGELQANGVSILLMFGLLEYMSFWEGPRILLIKIYRAVKARLRTYKRLRRLKKRQAVIAAGAVDKPNLRQ